jgi:hypothetical protein
VLLRDDPPEGVSVTNGGKTFSVLHTWLACCTDGYVIGALDNASFPAYVQFTLNTSYDWGQLLTWAAASSAGPSLPLALVVGRRVRLDLFQDVGVDIKPQSCPNPVNTNSKGVLPVAILGGPGFDVAAIDPSTVTLEGVPALRSSVEDVGTPVGDGEDCECTEAGADGYPDLTLKFDTQAVVQALGAVDDGDVLVLTLSGSLTNGFPIKGSDCVVIRAKGGGKKVASLKNSPNPHNPSTTITYTLTEAAHVRLSIYNLLGQEVAVLFSGGQAAGSHSVRWDGRDGLAREVTSGVYLYRLEADGEILVRKTVLAK